MKKIIWLFIAAFFVFGLSVWGATASAEREKILSPDQIKNYREIIKKGNELFGVLANKAEDVKKEDVKKREDAKRLVGNVNGSLSTDSQSTGTPKFGDKEEQGRREKILSPDMISSYEKIQRVGTALWGMKKGAGTASSSPIVRAENATCVAAAIDTKDKAVMDLITSTAVSLNTAVSARSVCQQKVVQLAENQKAALDVCIKDFRTAQKSLQESVKKSQQAIWSTYRIGLKNCQLSAGAATSTRAFEGELIIEDGGGSLMVDAAVDSSAK